MSDFYVRLIPTDPSWQPAPDAAEDATAYVRGLFAGPGDGADEVAHEYFEQIQFIDAGENTQHVTCPACGKVIGLEWVFDVVSERHPDLGDLGVDVPCCGVGVSLNDLEYDWPVGFARFQITVMNGTRDDYELQPDELARVEALLGHPVRQVLAHY